MLIRRRKQGICLFLFFANAHLHSFVSENQSEMRIKNIKHKVMLVVSGMFISVSLMANDSLAWNLDDCLVYAAENNISILRSGLQFDESEINLKEAKASLFPSLTFNTNQNVNFDNEADDHTVYSGTYNLTAGMTIYNGGRRLNTIEQSKISREYALWNFLTTSNNIKIQIIRQYYQLLYTHESVLTNEQIVITSVKELERSTELFRSGMISKVDLAQVESQYKKDNYQLVMAKTSEAEALLALKQLLQLSNESDFEVDYVSDNMTDLPLVPVLTEVLDNALMNMPEIKGATAQIKISQLERKIAAGEWIPTISLNASVTTGHNTISPDNFGKQIGKGFNENVGVTLSVPLYNNRQTKSKVERAKVSILDAELNYENVILEVSNTITTIHLDAISAQSQYDAALAQLAAAEESYDLVQQKFNLGMLNAVDLLVEKNSLLNAIQDKIQAKYSALLDIRLLEFYNNIGQFAVDGFN